MRKVAIAALLVLGVVSNAHAFNYFVDIPVGTSVFQPRTIVIIPGDSVTWRNPAGGMVHGVQSDDGTSFSFPLTAAPWTFSKNFGTPGTYPYYCQAHGAPNGIGMSGVIYVGNRTAHVPTDHILQLSAWDFTPLDNVTTTNSTINAFRFALTGNPAQLATGLHLPTGAEVTGLEVDACDLDPANDISVGIARCIAPDSSCLTSNNVITSGPTGCGFYSAFQTETIDNLGNDYYVRVLMAPTSNLSFRAVRVYYRLAVSSSPAVATFSDVPTSHLFYRYIEALAASGITAGCAASPPQYCPDAPVTRGQMAVFLARSLGLFFPN
jgi:plastocyanin